MQEQPHVVYVLNILKNILPPPSESLLRLPSYTTLILLHALRGIFYPSNFIYPLTARFLLQRPTLDMTDVPMLYGMLYSSSDDWKKERGWIIRFLSDGMMSTDDWRVLKRRHTWELLASLFQSSEHDLALRNGILEVIIISSHLRQLTECVGPCQLNLQRTSDDVTCSEVLPPLLDRNATSCLYNRSFCMD
jgi:nucleolar pre-ribosomal-associated protein 1